MLGQSMNSIASIVCNVQNTSAQQTGTVKNKYPSLCLSQFLSPDLLMCLLALPPSILSNHAFASFLIMQLLSRTQANNTYLLIVSGAPDNLMHLGFPNIETGALQLTAPQDSKYCL